MMYGLRQTVSLLLFAFGGLLVALGAASLFVEPSEDVSPAIARSASAVFASAGVVGLVLIAWGIYLRCRRSQGESRRLWGMYVVLLAPLVGLALFVGNEVIGIVAERSSPWKLVRYVSAFITLLGFLFGPVVLLFRHDSAKKNRRDEMQKKRVEQENNG